MLIKRSLWRMCGGLAVAAALSMFQSSSLRADDEAPQQKAAAADEDAAAAAEEPTEGDDVRVEGKIIVIGPDGEKREFDFGRNFPKDFMGPRVKMSPRGPGRFHHDEDASPRGFFPAEPEFAAGDYMIGLHCDPADDTLRSQLRLGEKGLVVRTVVDGSPAAEAGMQQHDVLVRIGDQELTKLAQLFDAVQDAKETPLSLTIIRAGEEQTLEVTPAKREDLDLPAALSVDVSGIGPEGRRAMKWLRRHRMNDQDFRARPGQFRFEAIGPGILLREARADNAQQLQEQIDELKSQLEKLQETVEELSRGDE